MIEQEQDPVSAMIRLSHAQEMPGEMATARARAAAQEAWHEAVRRRRRRRRIATLFSVAAVVLAAVALNGLFRLSAPAESGTLAALEQIVGDVEVEAAEWNDSGDRSVALGVGSVLETAAKGRASFRLNNGSRVRLDSATRIRLAGSRSLELEEGALYFASSSSGSDQGSSVESSQVEIRTPLATLANLGTAYEVRVLPGELVVAVRSGSVQVDVSRGAGGGSTIARRGQLLRLRGDGSTTIEVLEPTDPRFEWTRPLIEPFDIDGKTIGQFVDWVEHESGLEIRLGAGVDSSVLDLRLRGDVVWTSPEEAIEPTLQMAGARVRFDDGQVIVDR